MQRSIKVLVEEDTVLGLTKLARGTGNVGLREWPEPAAGPGQVLIAVRAAGICGTDLHVYDDTYLNRPPVIMGHEGAGEVVAVGPGVSGWAVGDRVTALPFAATCGHCPACQHGMYGQCEERRPFGSQANGTFAPYLAAPAGVVRRLPAHVDDESGALVEPLACMVKAVLLTASIRAGDVVLVLGPGPIGLLALQLARLQGATTILAGAAADTARLAVGQALGAERTAAAPEETTAALAELTGGRGADVVLECSGAPAATRAGLGALRRRGQYVQIGLHGRTFELDFEEIARKDAVVLGSVASSAASWERALVLLEQRRVELKPLISAVLPLAEWERGMAMARSKAGLKVVLRP